MGHALSSSLLGLLSLDADYGSKKMESNCAANITTEQTSVFCQVAIPLD